MAKNLPSLKTWKVIALGSDPKDGGEFYTALGRAGWHIGRRAGEMLLGSDFKVKPEKAIISLARVTVADLGFRGGVTGKEIYSRAIECGLSLCPVETAPRLCLQYTDKAEAEFLSVMSETMVSDGRSCVFVVVSSQNDRILSEFEVCPEEFWFTGCAFLFQLNG